VVVKNDIKAVIFDFFDVIHTDPQKAWLNANGLERTSVFAKAATRLDLGEIDIDEYLKLMSQGHGSKTADEVRAEYAKYMKLDKKLVQLIKDLRRADYKIALVSNAHTNELRPVLKRYKLEPLFDEVVISSEVGIIKPDPEIFKLILKRLKISPEQAIFIDDSQPNVDAAETLGIVGICHIHHVDSRQQLIKLGLKF